MIQIKRIHLLKIALITLTVLCLFSCKQQKNLQSMIDVAVKNKDSVLVVPDGKYVIEKPIILSGVNNLIIRGEKPGDVIITSGMDVPVKKLTRLDEAAGLYEITVPELKNPTWPDSS